MKFRAIQFRLYLAVFLASLISAAAVAKDDIDVPVVEVTVVKVHGSTSEYLEKYRPMIDVIKKHEPRAQVNVYQAVFAGTNYGLLHLSIRYPSIAALAAANPKIVADPEHDRVIEQLVDVKREIVSHYMLRDRTPE